MECIAMVQRFRRGFSAAEETELWDRWQKGESLKAIGRAFGKPSSSIYCQVAPVRRISSGARAVASVVSLSRYERGYATPSSGFCARITPTSVHPVL